MVPGDSDHAVVADVAVSTAEGHDERIAAAAASGRSQSQSGSGRERESRAPVFVPDRHVRESRGRLRRWVPSEDPESGETAIVFFDASDTAVSTIRVHRDGGSWVAAVSRSASRGDGDGDGDDGCNGTFQVDLSQPQSQPQSLLPLNGSSVYPQSTEERPAAIEPSAEDPNLHQFGVVSDVGVPLPRSGDDNESSNGNGNGDRDRDGDGDGDSDKDKDKDHSNNGDDRSNPGGQSGSSASTNGRIQKQTAIGNPPNQTSNLPKQASSSNAPNNQNHNLQSQNQSATYPPDTYSLLSLHGPIESTTFFSFGMMVFLVQMAFLLLMMISVFDKEWSTHGDIDNPGGDPIAQFVAAKTSPIVRWTQVLAVITYVAFTDSSFKDITTAVETFPSGLFSPLASRASRGELRCMVFSCGLRFLQGAMAMFAAFILIITSTSVIDIILNFTAVNFISSLDELAFAMLLWGKYGPWFEYEAKRIASLPLPPCQQQKNKYSRFQCTVAVFGVIHLGMICGVIYAQDNDDIWLTKALRVEFQKDTGLRAFSGCYQMSDEGETFKRKVYTNSDLPQIASIGYCIDDRRWMLFSGRNNACEAGERKLAYSVKTDSFDVSTSFDEGWFSASGAPLDLYFVEFSEDLEDQCSSYDNGICTLSFNNFDSQYDGGDCCSATCSHSNCGIGAVTEAFGVQSVTGDGFPECTDPKMVPITIRLDNFTSSRSVEILEQKYTPELIEWAYMHESSDDFLFQTFKNPASPLLMLECDGKIVLQVDINENMSGNTETVNVSDGATCTLQLENTTSPLDNITDAPIWYLDYKIFHGDDAERGPMILEMNSDEQGKSSFFRIPTCMFEKLSENVDVQNIYNDSSSVKTLEWMYSDTTGASDCDDDFFIDRYALGVLNFAAPPTDGGNQNLWIRTTQQCLWPTIECEDGYLSSLILNELYLLGTIPKTIGLLTSLTKLKMDLNSISGQIPSQIGSLTKLEELYLNNNELTGQLPSQLGFLTKLKKLYMHDNYIKGYVSNWIESLKSLKVLELGSNRQTGQIPSYIQSLDNLEELYLYSNSFTGQIPTQIGSLKMLRRLHLSSNDLTGQIPSQIASLTKLSVLSLNTNGLTGQIPTHILSLTNLEKIYLSHNSLTGQIPIDVGSLTKLTGLYLRHNFLTGQIPNEIGFLTNIEVLNLYFNGFTGQIPSQIGFLTNLNMLYLDQNSLTGQIPSQIEHLENLKELYLYQNFLTGPIPSELGSLTDLVGLSFYQNILTGSIPSQFGSLTKLTGLYLYQNGLGGQIPSQIGYLINLAELSLQFNNLTGPIPSHVGSLTNLNGLYLNHNSFKGQIPSQIGSLTNLFQLYLYGNDLTGPIPSQFGSLTELMTLSLGDNSLVGQIPTQIGFLSNLTGLYLNQNNLTGRIPSQVGLLTKLFSLFLFGNGLTGQIPSEIGTLTDLKFLSLNLNNFIGKIPKEVGSLTTLELLHLHANGLTGVIPSQVGGMTNLLQLSFESNLLTGRIPTEVGLLPNIQYLDLADNALSGAIPSQIGLLTSLTHLALGNNSLTGPIPSEVGLLTNLNCLEVDGDGFALPIPSGVQELLDKSSCGE